MREPAARGAAAEETGRLKLHADTSTALNTVTAYGPGFIDINQQRQLQAVLIAPDRPVERWQVDRFDNLAESHFAALRDARPDVVLLGTGARQRFPHPRLTRALTEARIGLEVMDTPAACRTYNILTAEGRKVLAALLLED